MSGKNLDVRVRLLEARTAELEAKKVSRAIGGIGPAGRKAGVEASQGLDRVHGSVGRMRSAVSYAAGAAGLGGLAYGIKDVVKEGMAWQSQEAQLQNALRNTGQSVSNLRVINRALEESATQGGFSAQEESGGLAQLTRLTGSTTQAIRLNAEAVDIARGAHVDYGQAIRMVSQIQTGNTGRLQKYLGIIQPVTDHVKALTAAQKKADPTAVRQAQLLDKQATAAKANSIAMQKFGGATAAYSRTAQGAMSNASNSINLVVEQLGAKFLPIVAKVGAFIARHAKTIAILVLGLTALAAVVGTVIMVTKAWTLAQEALNIVMDANPIGLIIIAVALLAIGIAVAYKKVKWFRDGVNAVFGWLKTAVSDVIGFVRQHWRLIAGILLMPFTGGLSLIILNFGKVKRFILGIINWMRQAFADAFKFIASLPGKAWHGATHFLTHGVVSWLNPVGQASHTISAVKSLLGLARGGLVPGYASGGVIAGSGTGDNRLIRATPGEFMLRKRVVDAIGVRNLQQLNETGSFGVSVSTTTTPIYLGNDFARPVAELVAHHVAKMQARR